MPWLGIDMGFITEETIKQRQFIILSNDENKSLIFCKDFNYKLITQ